MDFGSLQRRTKRYWRKTKWCSVFVLFTLANLLITICISAVWSSQEPQVFAKLSVNTCVMLACSFLVIKQNLDANKSIRSEQLAFEGLMADFKGAEASNDELQTELSESQLKCIDLQTKLDAAEQDLEKTRCENDELRKKLEGAEASNSHLRGFLRWSLANCRKLRKKLRANERELELANRILRDEIVFGDKMLYVTEVLQNELSTEQNTANKLRIERNELRVEREKFLIKVNDLNKKLTEASVGFQRFRYLHYGAGAKSKIDYTKRRITSFEDVVDILNDVIDRLRQQHGE